MPAGPKLIEEIIKVLPERDPGMSSHEVLKNIPSAAGPRAIRYALKHLVDAGRAVPLRGQARRGVGWRYTKAQWPADVGQ
jgi:repressor of nif and glnA expression